MKTNRSGLGEGNRTRVAALLIVAGLIFALGAPSSSAQSDGGASTAPALAADSPTENEKNEQAQADKAKEVDAANAELSELTNALSVLNNQVAEQQARLAEAEEQVIKAEAAVDITEGEVSEAEGELARLEADLNTVAIETFVGDGADADILVSIGDPNKALRMEEMRESATQSDLELVEELRSAQDDLDTRRADASAAVKAADLQRQQVADQLAALERDQAAQRTLIADAEDRLDHLLEERAELAKTGNENALPEPDKLVETLAATSPPPTQPPVDIEIPAVVSEADIESVGKGIKVHKSIAPTIRQLLADAAADGVPLEGGGYRSVASQIAVRKNNCGTSNYAIYEMRASQCSPPTARPGASQHQKGLAIDFTTNGKLIRSRSGPAWNWLEANGARYGLKNLPSEPWHWSTTGR